MEDLDSQGVRDLPEDPEPLEEALLPVPDPLESLDRTEAKDLPDLLDALEPPELPDSLVPREPPEMLDLPEATETPDSPDSLERTETRERRESVPSTALSTEESSSRTEPDDRSPTKNFLLVKFSFLFPIFNKRFYFSLV